MENIPQLFEKALQIGIFGLFMAVVGVLFICGCARCLQELWNESLREVFNSEEITYKQAIGIQIVPLVLATPVLVLLFLFTELEPVGRIC